MTDRWIWVFEVMDGPGSAEKPWQFVKYMAANYLTEHHAEARKLTEFEYGVTIRGAQRRLLTFPEYVLLLRCKSNTENDEAVRQAMLRIVFTGSIQNIETA